jgi:hypothetical protein
VEAFSFHLYLFKRVNSFFASGTLVLCSTEDGRYLAGSPSQLWLLSFSWLKVFAEIARFLEELLKMSLAVQNSVHGGIVAHLKGSFAMGTPEARLVVRHSFNGQHVHHIDCLITNIAFVESSCERHFFCFIFFFFGFFFGCCCFLPSPRSSDNGGTCEISVLFYMKLCCNCEVVTEEGFFLFFFLSLSLSLFDLFCKMNEIKLGGKVIGVEQKKGCGF